MVNVRMCVALAVVTMMVVAASPALSQDYSRTFEWPSVDPHAIPDARLRNVLASATEEARQAADYSRQGTTAASQARRLVGIRTAIGRGPQPQTVGDGVVMAAVPYGDEGGSVFGELTWANGATLTGALSVSMGAYDPPIESSVQRFTGFVWGATNPVATPMTGHFDFKSGDSFLGSYRTGHNAIGVYASADGSRRFVGEIDFSAPAFRPLRGNLMDRDGRTLAVVNVREP